MRQAFNDVAVLLTTSEEGNTTKGISLGFDHCAEHEWGTSGIRSALGVTQNFGFEDFIKDYDAADKAAPRSIEDFKISKNAKVVLLTAEISATKLKSSYSSEKQIEAEYKTKYKEKLNKKRVPAVTANIAILMTASWSIGYLAERLADKHPVLAQKLKQEAPFHAELTDEEFETLNQEYVKANTGQIRTQAYVAAAAEHGINLKLPSYWKERHESHWGSNEFMFVASGKNECQVVKDLYSSILSGSAYYGVKLESNPFSRSSPCLLAAHISEEEKNAVAQQWADLRAFSKEILQTGIHEKLKTAGKRYYALAPRRAEDGSVQFWLNPCEQNKYNYGWFNLDQLSQWAENTGPIVKA